MAAYQFVPLPNDGDSIRLLHVQPSSSWAGPMICTLEISKLSDSPSYVALSYTWGSAVHDHVVKVDGLNFPVTESLYSALQLFRHASQTRSTAEGGGSVLWADQISINQADDTERSLQVAMMKRVYETAQSVDVSLGYGPAEKVRLVHELL
jgi:Heterokaryon incompatibility protein (HET)